MKHILSLLLIASFLISAIPAFVQANDIANDMATQSPALSDEERRELQVIERFWTLLERTPRRGTSLDRVYGYYVDTGRLEELVARCKELTEKSPDNAKAWLLSGLVLSRRNDDAATAAALEKAMTLDETDLLAPFYLGETYIAQGRLRDAAETLEVALKRAQASLQKNTGDRAVLGRDTLAILQTLGRVYERFDDRENSTRVWDELEKLFPGDRDILVRIAETLEEEGKFDEALKRYHRLAEMAKTDNFARVQYALAAADIMVRLGNKQEAIDSFETLLEDMSADNWLSRSIRDRVERIFVRQADYAGLAGYYQKRLQKYPNDVDTVRRYAVALLRLSRTEEAKQLLADALERAPSNVPLRLALIDLLVADRDFDAVDRHYAIIDEIEPNNIDHISQRGLAILENTKLREQARKAAAIRIWSTLITARPDDPSILIVVADLANTAKIDEEAEKLFARAIELRPNDPSYKEYLGYFYHHRERKEEAIATLRQMTEGTRHTAANLAQLGSIFKSLGYAEESMSALKEAVTLDPDNIELRMQYADLLVTNEKSDEAEQEYLAAEKLARPLTDEFARFLNAYTRLLQTSGRLKETAEALAKQLTGNDAAIPGGDGTDFWRLATYQMATGQWDEAAETIEKAVALAPTANILLEAAASIFEKGHDQVRAAAIYERLATADPQRRVEHLKRLASLRRDLGEMDKAIDTARLVMATGAGNAANSRFYAEMLLSVGRHKDGIETLRRAVRLDPTDTTTLSSLAEVLFDSGDIDEALEIQWRIFQRTEDLQGKIGAVSRMSAFYQLSQRFDQLVERLRQTSIDPASRREAAYCLSQAYVTVSDYEQARKTLEMLLLGGDDKETDDTLLLSQLSSISELQGDILTAIRYQEMLCDRLQGGAQAGRENERLLALYQQSGEKEKAITHVLKVVIDKGDLREQIQAIDDLLAREDYESAQKILDRIEGRHPHQWEVLYRRLMLSFWRNDFERAAQTARKLLALEIPRDELSAKKQLGQTQPAPTATTPQQQPLARLYGQNYSPWGFGGQTQYFGLSGMDTTLQRVWLTAHQQLFFTLFRERLQLEQYYYQRSSSMGPNNTEPPKPQWEPATFGDARFAAAAWLLRMALKREPATVSPADSPVSPPVPPPSPSEQNGFTLDHFTAAIDAWRASLPADATDVLRIEERLRLEYFFQQWFQIVSQAKSSFPEGDYAKLLFTLKDVEGAKDPTETTEAQTWETVDGKPVPTTIKVPVGENATQPLRHKLEYQLAVLGKKEWLPTAYQTMVREFGTHRVDALKQLDAEKEFDAAVKNAPASFRERFSDEQIAVARKGLPEILDHLNLYQKIFGDNKTPDLLTIDQKVAMIFLCWNRLLDVPLDPHDPSLLVVIPTYSHVLNLLKQRGREQDAAALEAIASKAAEANPLIDVAMAQSLLTSPPTQSTAPAGLMAALMARKYFREQFGEHLAETEKERDLKEWFEQLQQCAAFDVLDALTVGSPTKIVVAFDPQQFETFQAGIERLKKALSRTSEMAPSSPTSLSAQVRSSYQMMTSPETQPFMFDNFMMQYLSRIMASVQDVVGVGSASQTFTVSSSGQVSLPRVEIPGITPGLSLAGSATNTEKKPITPEQFTRIAIAEKEVYRLLDYYFEQMNEIDGGVGAKNLLPLQTGTPQQMATPQRRTPPPTLVSYKDYFDRNRVIRSSELQNILQGTPQQQGGVVRMVQQPQMPTEQTLMVASQFFKMLDEAVKSAEIEPVADPTPPLPK